MVEYLYSDVEQSTPDTEQRDDERSMPPPSPSVELRAGLAARISTASNPLAVRIAAFYQKHAPEKLGRDDYAQAVIRRHLFLATAY